MPIHDWTRVEAGLFHHFHQDWSVEIARTLNRGMLPKGYYALVEQRTGGPEPDVIAVETPGGRKSKPSRGGVSVVDAPRTRMIASVQDDLAAYAKKANRIVIRHHLGRVVAVIEIVSPGNKSSRVAVRSFVEKAIEFLRSGIHLMVIDLFPPSARDPQGLHKAIWEEYQDDEFELPDDQPLTLVGYDAGPPLTAYIETAAVGEALPDMPLFIARGEHVPVPLEETYAATWAATPEPIREMLSPPRRRK